MPTSTALQQARALISKHAVQQRRAIKTNICIISAPLVFVVLVWLLQNVVVRLLLSTNNFKCGCQCTQCCGNGNCTNLSSGICDTTQGFICNSYNNSNCGIQFSTTPQAVWCEIPVPSSWPPVMKIPPAQYRAQPWQPNLAMLYTGLTSAAGTVADHMFPELTLSPTQIPNLSRQLANLVNPTGTVVNGYLLSLLGFQFASVQSQAADYYLDPAFLGSSTSSSTSDGYVYVILPEGTCEERNLLDPLPIRDFLIRYFTGSVPLPPALLSQFLGGSSDSNGTSGGGGGGTSGSVLLGSVNLLCVDAIMEPRTDQRQINSELYCGWRNSRCNGTSIISSYTGAWDYRNSTLPNSTSRNNSRFDAVIDYNQSLPMSQTPKTYRIPAMLNAAVRGWAASLPGNIGVRTAGSVQLLGLMSFPKPAGSIPFDLSSLLGPLFYTWVVQLLLPTFLQQLVYEKEKRLRMMMRIHGLGDGAYWSITYLWYMILYICYIFVFMLFGSLIRLELFVQNNYGVQAITYLIFGNCMIAFTFVLSCFFTSSRTAEAFGYMYVLATGLLGALLLSAFMEQNAWFMPFLELVPGFALYRALWELGSYSQFAVNTRTSGLNFAKLRDPANGTIVAWIILLIEWPVFMLLAYYLEQVLGSGAGARRRPLFFLQSLFPKKKQPLQLSGTAGGKHPWSHATSAAPGSGSSAQPLTGDRGALAGDLELGPSATPPSPPSAASPCSSPSVAAAAAAAAVNGGVAGATSMAAGAGAAGPARSRAASEPAVNGGAAAAAGAALLPTTPRYANPDANPDAPIKAFVPGDAAAAAAEKEKEKEREREARPRAGSAGQAGERVVSPKSVAVSLLPNTPRYEGSVDDAPSAKPATPGFGVRGFQVGVYPDVEDERDRVERIIEAAAAQEEVQEGVDGVEGGAAKKVGDTWPVVIHNLSKIFPSFQGGTERHAVRGMNLAIADGECFGLLGPNGAGKTTMLNMLTGFLEPSGGTARLAGLDIKDDMRQVYKLMGVCPQDNLLWESLTAREHLRFFGRLKGLTGKELDAAVDEALHGVNLFKEGDKQAGKFSGGMKRRLSVAISLIGSPRVVFLDEPSTGLDPASRRALWEVVKQRKPGRGLILTTHSMEEAEVLCDRLGIYVDGRLVCIGNPKEITSRFAGYLVFTITVPQGEEDAARRLVARISPNAVHTYGLAGTLKYELPTSDISLSGVFEAMHLAQELKEVHILDWGVANATLEEVFISVARRLGAETAQFH